MKIYRDNKEYELTTNEIFSAWIEYQEKLDKEEMEIWRDIIKNNILNFSYDKNYEDEIIGFMLSEIWEDVKNLGVDFNWALGVEEYSNGGGGLYEYYLNAISNLDT